MNELALFAGAGGGILGGKLLGWKTICAVEVDAYCAAILATRQNDGLLDLFPIWSDVRTFDGRPWRGTVDVVSCGFPCQDISAGGAGKGISGARSGLWSEGKRIIHEVRPHFVLVENSPRLTSRGLNRVLGDLAEMGFDAKWGVLGGRHVGAPHRRDRIWIVATHSAGNRLEGRELPSEGRKGSPTGVTPLVPSGAWPDLSNPHAFGSNDGLANRVDRTKAIGNGQIPAVVRLAWQLLNS